MSADPNFKDFQLRVNRIEKAHRKGYGFEAAGTQGRSARYRRKGITGRVLRGFLIMLAISWAMKGVFYFAVGTPTYDARLATLKAGGQMEQLAAVVMTPDPLTLLIAAFMGEVLPQLK